MRNVAVRTGKNPKKIEPLVPVDLVVDHSVQIDYFRREDALDLNMKLEFDRNRERYQFMNGECRPSILSVSCLRDSVSCIR